MGAPYASETQGLVECRNKVVEQKLRTGIHDVATHGQNFAPTLPAVDCAMHGIAHEAIPCAPHGLIFGQAPSTLTSDVPCFLRERYAANPHGVPRLVDLDELGGALAAPAVAHQTVRLGVTDAAHVADGPSDRRAAFDGAVQEHLGR